MGEEGVEAVGRGVAPSCASWAEVVGGTEVVEMERGGAGAGGVTGSNERSSWTWRERGENVGASESSSSLVGTGLASG